MEFDLVVKKRSSVKKFISKKPPIEKIVECAEIANLAPTPGNVHIIRYLVVDDPYKISIIADACQQDFIRKSPYVVIICTDLKLVRKLFDERAETYIKHHVGTAVENFLLKAVDLGFGASLVEIFSEETLRHNLGIPDDIVIEVVIPLGYELGKSKEPVQKKSLYNRLFFNNWGERFYKPITVVKRDVF